MPVIRHQQLSTIPLRHGVKIFSYNVGKNSDRQAQTLKDEPMITMLSCCKSRNQRQRPPPFQAGNSFNQVARFSHRAISSSVFTSIHEYRPPDTDASLSTAAVNVWLGQITNDTSEPLPSTSLMGIHSRSPASTTDTPYRMVSN
jgi:hypothetical protein